MPQRIYKLPRSLHVALIWFGCLVLGLVGVIFAGGYSAATDDHVSFGSGLSFLFLDPPIILAAILAGYNLSKKVRAPEEVIKDKLGSKRFARTLLFMLLGFGFAWYGWLSLVEARTNGTLLPWVAVAFVIDIFVYAIAGSYVFSIKDPVRLRVWTLITYLAVLIVPSYVMRVLTH
jgi:hypothetical protein